jgi:hypothetical protein
MFFLFFFFFCLRRFFAGLLLPLDFNQCIMLFSNLPELDMEQVSLL